LCSSVFPNFHMRLVVFASSLRHNMAETKHYPT
jgi:hypothetical protein